MVPIFALSQNYPDEIALSQSCLYDVVVVSARANISDICRLPLSWHEYLCQKNDNFLIIMQTSSEFSGILKRKLIVNGLSLSPQCV